MIQQIRKHYYKALGTITLMYNTVITHSDGDERRDPGPAGLVGSGKAVGGVVSDVSDLVLHLRLGWVIFG